MGLKRTFFVGVIVLTVLTSGRAYSQDVAQAFFGNVIDPRGLTVTYDPAKKTVLIRNSAGQEVFEGKPSQGGPLIAEKWRTIIKQSKESNRLLQIFNGRNTDDSLEISKKVMSQDVEAQILDLKKKLAECEEARKDVSDRQFKELKETIEQLGKKLESRSAK